MNLASFWHFFKGALRNPLTVSTVFETGDKVSARLTLKINPDDRVVELGVGTGAITEAILKRMSRQENYLGFELDASMLNFAKKRFPQAKFVHGSAEAFPQHLEGQKVQAVISSLPWTLMPADKVNSILKSVAANLSPEGYFATYITLHVLKTPAGKRVQAAIESQFSQIETDSITNNLPPAKIFIARL